jgi:hypothetical protein
MTSEEVDALVTKMDKVLTKVKHKSGKKNNEEVLVNGIQDLVVTKEV